MIIKEGMAVSDIIGQESIAPEYQKIEEKPLIPARGVVPGEIWKTEKEGKKLISGRGVIP